MSDLLSTAEVARLLHVRPDRVRQLVRTGLCRPRREGSAYRFEFRDVVVLRAAQELGRQRIGQARLRAAIERLEAELGDVPPLSGCACSPTGGVWRFATGT